LAETGFGIDSEGRSHIVENILSVVTACRKQGRDMREYLIGCCRAALEGTPPAILLSADERVPTP
jgi:hypothetical protein